MHKIHKIHAFNDNFIWLISDEQKSACVVDPGDAAPVLKTLANLDLCLSEILVTHHHPDHTGGIRQLKQQFPDVAIYGPKTERFEELVTQPVGESDQVQLKTGGMTFAVAELPGHTLDHIGFLNPDCAFVGDTLFSAGCGRLFEGSAEQMFHSLNKLGKIDNETPIYCAHEYTLANLEFAQQVEPDNGELKAYYLESKAKRESGDNTIPTRMAIEKQINPFLRSHLSNVQTHIQNKFNLLNTPDAVECFAYIRQWKDKF